MSIRTNILGCTKCSEQKSAGRNAAPGRLINTPVATVGIEIPNSELYKLAAIVFAGVLVGNLIGKNL